MDASSSDVGNGNVSVNVFVANDGLLNSTGAGSDNENSSHNSFDCAVGRIPTTFYNIIQEFSQMKNNILTPKVHGTTVLGIVRNGRGVMAADGQVSFNNTVIKHSARKVRRLYNNLVLAGFAGATADAFTLLQRFEDKLETHRGNLDRAAVDLARDWRTDRYLRRLEAMLLVMSAGRLLLISGTGDVIEPDDEVIAIGSGGAYALAAARALLAHSSMPERDIAQTSMRIAADICVFTNQNILVEEIGFEDEIK